MPISEEINKAIAAHGIWKGRLQEAIATGKSSWTVEQVRTDTACDFGRWLLSLPQSELASARGAQVREMHAEFHRQAAMVLALALGGDQRGAQQAIASHSEFSNLSAKLTLTLMEWKKAAD